MSPFFLQAKAERRAVVGRLRGDELDLLRVARRGDQYRLLAAATISWNPGTALGEPLERLLDWRAVEPVILAVPTPALAGGSVTIRRAPPSKGQGVLDPRELKLQAHWHAREQLRDEVGEFFGSPLEDLLVVREDVRPWQETPDRKHLEATVTTIFQAPAVLRGSPSFGVSSNAFTPSTPPPDVPSCDMVFLPLFFSELFCATSEPTGLLVSEESRLSLIVRRGDLLRTVRTAPLGSDMLTGMLVRALSCSPRDAATLLQRADASALSLEGVRILSKVFRPLFPLFRTVIQLFFEHLPDTERPARMLVAGFWPTLLHRLFLHRNLTLHLAGPRRAVQLLPRPMITPIDGARLTAARIPSPVFSLLEQLADAAFRKSETAPAAVRESLSAYAHAP